MENVIERTARYADIDTRRALGVLPRRLPKSDFVPRPIKPTTWRYFPVSRKLMYVNFDESYDVYTWDVYDDVDPVDYLGARWLQEPFGGRHKGVWRNRPWQQNPGEFFYFDEPNWSERCYLSTVAEIIPGRNT